MYSPKHFTIDELARIQHLITENSFAPLISLDAEKKITTTFLPLSLQFENNVLKKIRGHFAKNNPHWKSLSENPECTVLFQGPHTYITPLWYKSGRDVPTWNYCVVEVTGQAKMIDDFKGICQLLKELTSTFEPPPKGWRMELPDDLKNPADLTNAIIGFEIEVVKINAKFKLSQNRPAIDQQGVIDGLTTERQDENSLKIRDMMKENLKPKF